MDEVNKAEKVVRELEEQKEALIGRTRILAKQREQLSYAAHAGGDKGARGKLNQIITEFGTISGEIESMDAALREATQRLVAARQDEAGAADKANAEQASLLKLAFVENGVNAGDALSDFIGSILEMKQQRDDMEALGIKAPTSRQFLVSAVIAIKTILQQLPQPMVNELQDWRLLLVPQRRSFKDITADWDAMIDRQIAQRLGEQKKDAA